MCIAPLSNIGNVLIYFFNLFKLFLFLYGMTRFLNFCIVTCPQKYEYLQVKSTAFYRVCFVQYDTHVWHYDTHVWYWVAVDGRTHRCKLQTQARAELRCTIEVKLPEIPGISGAKHRRTHCPAAFSLNTRCVCLKVSEKFNFNLCSLEHAITRLHRLLKMFLEPNDSHRWSSCSNKWCNMFQCSGLLLNYVLPRRLTPAVSRCWWFYWWFCSRPPRSNSLRLSGGSALRNT